MPRVTAVRAIFFNFVGRAACGTPPVRASIVAIKLMLQRLRCRIASTDLKAVSGSSDGQSCSASGMSICFA
jgi:hypothetical protein